MQHRPMRKQSGVSRHGFRHPLSCTPPMPSQAYVFRHHPVREALVQIAQRGIKRRLVVTTIVVHPTPDYGVEHPRQIVDPPVDSTAQFPVTDFLSDSADRRVADTGTEVDEELTPPILRSAGAKTVAQNIEFRVGICFPPVIILAVHDTCLVRMKLQSTLRESLRQMLLQFPCLILTATMAEDIVGEPLNRHIRMVLGHPPVERIVKKQITQQG